MSLMFILAGAAPVWRSIPVRGPVTLILADCCSSATTSLAHSASAASTNGTRSVMVPLLRRCQKKVSWDFRSKENVEHGFRSEVCGRKGFWLKKENAREAKRGKSKRLRIASIGKINTLQRSRDARSNPPARTDPDQGSKSNYISAWNSPVAHLPRRTAWNSGHRRDQGDKTTHPCPFLQGAYQESRISGQPATWEATPRQKTGTLVLRCAQQCHHLYGHPAAAVPR